MLNHAVGDSVITSGYAIFPDGIMIGTDRRSKP